MNLYYRLSKFLVITVIGVLFSASLLSSLCSAESEETIVATVNKDFNITQKQLDQTISEYQLRSQKSFTTKEEKIELLHNLIRRQLILGQDAIETYRNDPQIKQKIKYYENTLVVKKYLEDNIGQHMNTSEKDLKDYYWKNRHKFASPTKVKARHILLRTREDAQQVYEKLKKGADFVQLAKEYSIDLPTARKGGEMSPFPIPKGEAMPELDKVLFTLNEGEVSDIVETDYGYHIIRVDKIIPTDFKPFEEVKDQIQKELTLKLHNAAYDEIAAQLEKSADIKIFEDRVN